MNGIQLREMIRDIARSAFTNVQKQNAGEMFYTFALQTLDDTSGVYAAANTEAGYVACIESYQHRDEEHRPSERSCRWDWGMWQFASIDPRSFDSIYDVLNNGTWRGEQGYEFNAVVFASMVAALKDLDSEGLFGRGSDRERITLLCTVHDSYSNVWVQEESVARLNGPAAHDTFISSNKCPSFGLVDVNQYHVDFKRLLNEWGIVRRV